MRQDRNQTKIVLHHHICMMATYYMGELCLSHPWLSQWHEALILLLWLSEVKYLWLNGVYILLAVCMTTYTE